MIAAPVAAYVLLMFALAIFVLHPPLIGWIGLFVVAAAASTVAAGLIKAWPRLGVSGPRLHPREDGVYRLLIVADTDVDAELVTFAVRARTVGRPSEVHVVAPVLAGPAHFVTADETAEAGSAQRRLAAALSAVEAAEQHASGAVGTDDPLQAVADQLEAFPANEILFLANGPRHRNWAEHEIERRARDAFGVHCATVYGS
jgi:hypothetical protein